VECGVVQHLCLRVLREALEITRQGVTERGKIVETLQGQGFILSPSDAVAQKALTKAQMTLREMPTNSEVDKLIESMVPSGAYEYYDESGFLCG